jgi:DNA polymerase-1
MFDREDWFDLSDAWVMDIETDGIINPTALHCAVAKNIDTGEIREFIQPLASPNKRASFLAFLNKPRRVFIGHNFLNYDIRALRRLDKGVSVSDNFILDTLVLSRLFNYGLRGGHSLEAWGIRIGSHKQHADMTDFSTFTPAMLERCRSDVEVNAAIFFTRFKRFCDDPAWHDSILLEHFVASITVEMHDNGFPFATAAAEELYAELATRVAEIDKLLLVGFPPRCRPIKDLTPRLTQKGTLNAQDFRWWKGSEAIGIASNDLSVFTGGPFTVIEYEEFNAGSPSQIVERMNEFGWKPTEKTKGHIAALKDKSTPKARLEEYSRTGWRVCEENLKTLPDSAPEAAHRLAERLTLASRLSDLDEWLALVGEDGRIHGSFQPIGAWTHRLSHARPNLANIPVAKPSEKDSAFQKYINEINSRMRALFEAPPGWRLIGTDADGIQMRIFAHLVNDPRLIDAIVHGDKKKGTDIHSLHRSLLGDVCKSRDTAKTFIYAWLLGAGFGKVAEILECAFNEAKTAVGRFIDAYPGLATLKKKKIPEDAANGFFVGLDGRKVMCDDAHLMLAGYLQNGEKVIMARALRTWYKRLRSEGIVFQLVNWVHDEWQTLVHDLRAVVDYTKSVQCESFVIVGEQLNMNLPLAGDSKDGYTWKETH